MGEDPAAREVLEALPIVDSAKTVEEWMQRFQEGLDVIRSWFPTFTEFDHTVINSQTSFFLSASGFSDWRRALNKAAQSLKEFREKIDHQERVSLGLPLLVPHYRIQYHPVGGERTASPVWIRVVEIGNQYFPLFSFLTAPAPQVIEKRTHGEHSFAAPMEETLEHFRQRLREDGFLGGESVKTLHFTIGPVQGFVAQSRRTRDLLASSFMLSYLAGHGMVDIIRAGGEIQFPHVQESHNTHQEKQIVDSLLQAINETVDGSSKNEGPWIGSLPNRFRARYLQVILQKIVWRPSERLG